jgi:hypothetical protein
VFAELDITDRQATLLIQEVAAEMGRDALSNAKLVELREATAEFDAFLLSGATCDAIDPWFDDRYANVLGIVDFEAVSLLAVAHVVWGDTDGIVKFRGCFDPG